MLKMLKQIRHISEGNFYGLHVTNKAHKLSLEKELRTLEACKDAQSHGYRKEEKELMQTLKRLHRSKDSHHGQLELSPAPYSPPLAGAEDSTHQESTLIFTKPATGASNISIVIPLSPAGRSTVSAQVREDQSQLPPNEPTTEVGSEIHRTTAFTDCALCKLPRYMGGGKETGRICTCGPEHKKHIHVEKYHEEDEGKTQKRRKSHTEEEVRIALQKRDRRKSLETEHMLNDFLGAKHKNADDKTAATHGLVDSKREEAAHGHTDNKAGAIHGHKNSNGVGTFHVGERDHADQYSRHIPTGGSRRSSIAEQDFGPSHWSGLEGYENHIPGISARRRSSIQEYTAERPPARSRRSSFEEQSEHRSRRGSLEEYVRLYAPRSRRGSYEEHFQRSRHRSLDIGTEDEQNRQFVGRRSRKGTLDASYYRNRSVSIAGDVYHVRGPSQLPEIQSVDNTPAFHGLVHPDNVINHHHFLPHEAHRLRRASFNDRNHGNHHHGDHPHGGSYSHVAAAFDRLHEQDSGSRTYHTILTLKKMLSTYHDMESMHAPTYPWPRAPVINFTPEEFQKLKKCRYLRLPGKSNEEELEEADLGMD